MSLTIRDSVSGTAPWQVAPPEFDWPFLWNGDSVTLTIVRSYKQRRTDYLTDRAAARYLPGIYEDPETTGAYLVEESKVPPTPTALVSFSRTFANLPARQISYSTVSLTKPSPAGISGAIAYNMREVTGSGAYTNLGSNWILGDYYYAIVKNRIYGPQVATTSADNGADTDLTWTGHGLDGTQQFGVYQSSGTATVYLFSSGHYTVADPNTLKLTGFNLGVNGVYAAIFLRSYSPGLDRVGARVVTDYYLPGVSPGIATMQDVAIPSPLLNDSAFLAAVVANLTGYVTYDAKDLTPWMGPIYQLGTVQINMADID